VRLGLSDYDLGGRTRERERERVCVCVRSEINAGSDVLDVSHLGVLAETGIVILHAVSDTGERDAGSEEERK
jgi:hypothetical protein